MNETVIILLIISLGLAVVNAVVGLLLFRRARRESDLNSYIEIVQGYSEQIRDSVEQGNNVLINHLSHVMKLNNELLSGSINELAKVERENSNNLREQLFNQSNELRNSVNKSLEITREDNTRQLDNMRRIVDQTLVETLDDRLNKSYRIISDRLEAVNKGFSEMQQLASGVNDLKKVLSNVKSRGLWGEVMLGKLLEQMLTNEQFRAQVQIDSNGETVDYVVNLPGKSEDKVLLPIDSKFPDASYQRLLDSVDKPSEYEAAAKELVNDLKVQAKSISRKYIKPPITTDFAIMYLPTEGLFAEAIKREGLIEELQNNFRVIVAGPTTLAALLSSLQMGFKTVAIEKRSMEIRDILITFRTEFGKFTELLEQTQKRLDSASKSVEDATRKTKTISRKLSAVEGIGEEEYTVKELEE